MRFFHRPQFETTSTKSSQDVIQHLSAFAKSNTKPNNDGNKKYEIGLELETELEKEIYHIRILENWESVSSSRFEDDTNRREILIGSIQKGEAGTLIKLKGASELGMKLFLAFWYSLILLALVSLLFKGMTVEATYDSNNWLLALMVVLFIVLPYFIIYRSIMFRQKRAEYYLNKIIQEVL